MVDKKAADSNLNNDQRRNLAHIAKILQFAASKKGFATDSPHLEALNPFIIECHEKFKLFFGECCQVIIFHSPSSYVEHTIVVFLYAHWIALLLGTCRHAGFQTTIAGLGSFGYRSDQNFKEVHNFH